MKAIKPSSMLIYVGWGSSTLPAHRGGCIICHKYYTKVINIQSDHLI